MKKDYVLDTNVLIDNERAIEILKNGEENRIIIPLEVIEELDKLKKDRRIGHRVTKVISEIFKHKEYIIFLPTKNEENKVDNSILKTIQENAASYTNDLRFVTNDKILQLKSYINGIESEGFKRSSPFESESEIYNGFVNIENEPPINNSFYWKEGKLFFYSKNREKCIDYEHEIWGVKPRNVYENAAFELLLNDDIHLATIQSEAGKGKTYLSLASALYLAFQKKKYDKIYVFKSNMEIGEKLGFLPGDLGEKIDPMFKPVKDLLQKLHKIRPINRIFRDDLAIDFNPRYIEFLPLNYIRGMNIDDAVVIVDEMQNISRSDAKTLLSRMGDNVKCICTGDTKQIDNPYLNEDNNGLNWVVKLAKNEPAYGHIILRGKNTRGPICEMVLNIGL